MCFISESYTRQEGARGCFPKSTCGCSECLYQLSAAPGKAQPTKILKRLFLGKEPQIHWKKCRAGNVWPLLHHKISKEFCIGYFLPWGRQGVLGSKMKRPWRPRQDRNKKLRFQQREAHFLLALISKGAAKSQARHTEVLARGRQTMSAAARWVLCWKMLCEQHPRTALREGLAAPGLHSPQQTCCFLEPESHVSAAPDAVWQMPRALLRAHLGRAAYGFFLNKLSFNTWNWDDFTERARLNSRAASPHLPPTGSTQTKLLMCGHFLGSAAACW